MVDRNTTVIGVPSSISPEKFEQVLKDANSPAASAALEGYAYIVGAGAMEIEKDVSKQRPSLSC